MIRKSKLLICMLFMCLGLAVLPGMKSNAEETAGETASASENQDENSQRLEEITGMEEDGEIYEVTVEDGMVEETVNARARTAGPLIVNFNTKSSSVNTDYTDTVTGDSGYTNGSYGADAAYLPFYRAGSYQCKGEEQGRSAFENAHYCGRGAPLHRP